MPVPKKMSTLNRMISQGCPAFTAACTKKVQITMFEAEFDDEPQLTLTYVYFNMH